MQLLYLALAVLTSGYSGVSYKKLSMCSGNRSASFLLPVFWYFPLAVIFGICAACNGIDFSPEVLLPALLAGIAYAVCAFSLLESMKANSFSLTIIITNLSFVFPILLSIIFLNEQTHVLQFIGMLLAITVIVLLNISKKDGKSTLPAIMLALCSSLGNGMVDFAIKIHQHNMPGKDSNSFFFFAYIFAAVLCGGIYLAHHICGHKAIVVKEHRRELLINAPVLAVCNGVCFLVIGLLAGMMNAAAEFTVITSMSIAVSLFIGYLQMHKRITKREIYSLIICTIAIACQYFNLV